MTCTPEYRVQAAQANVDHTEQEKKINPTPDNANFVFVPFPHEI